MNQPWQTLIEFDAPSITGTERLIMEKAAAAAYAYLPPATLERLKTAVAEAVMNAIEHGNQAQPDMPIRVRVRAREGVVVVEVIDHGSRGAIPESTVPNLEAKLAGVEKPRGWGLFLIQRLTDNVQIENGIDYHMMRLTFFSGEDPDERKNA